MIEKVPKGKALSLDGVSEYSSGGKRKLSMERKIDKLEGETEKTGIL
jgi:hypothetical protein